MNPDNFAASVSGRAIRTPSGYWAFVPNPLPPHLEWTSELVSALSQADRALGALAGLSNTLPNPHVLVRPFIRREAVLSSRIEDTKASLSDLFVFEAQQLSLLETTSDVQEVHNYVAALEYGIRRMENFPMSLRLVREIHERLLQNVRGEQLTPGEFRRTQNWIGPVGSTINTTPFVPPPPEEMRQALADFENFLHAESELPPLVRLALIHYQFEAIHPFLDGNGRVGRLLISLLMGMWELLPQPLLYLSAYFESHRQTYYDLLLATSQRGAWNDWLLFFLDAVSVQSHDAVLRIQHLQNLRETYRKRVQTTRTSARLLQVVDLIFANPLVTIPQVQTYLKIQYPIAQRYIDKLVHAKILTEITGRSRNRVYRANEILAAIEAPLS